MTTIDAPPAVRPGHAGGLTLTVLALAALVASPAIWQCLVRHELPLHVMLERYVLIAVGCLAVSEVARRLLPQPEIPAETPAETPTETPTAQVASGADAPSPADTLVMQSLGEG